MTSCLAATIATCGGRVFGAVSQAALLGAPRAWRSARRGPGIVVEPSRRPINAVLPEAAESSLGEKAHKLAFRLRSARNFDDLYRSLVSEWQSPLATLRSDRGQIEAPPSLWTTRCPSGARSRSNCR